MATARLFRGFTLIELIVTFAIIGILLTLSITSYKDFQENQVVKQARETLVSNLRFAQSQAFGGVRDCGASQELLTGWFVSFSGTSYTVNARCGSTVGNNARIFPVGSGITLSTNIDSSSILFQPINKEAALLNGQTITPFAEDVTITLTKGSRHETVTVRRTGDVL